MSDSADSRDRAGRPPRKRRPEPSPSQRALGLLVRREHSRKELARKLAARGVAEDEAEQAVARMAREGWQDDARFAASLARSRASCGYGPVRIRAELDMHGIDPGIVAEAFTVLAEAGEDDWPARASALLRRRYGAAIGDPATRRKAAGFLIRRGFDAETVRMACGSDAADAGFRDP